LASVNLFGTIRVTKAFLPLIRRSQGRVVNISSITGILSTPFLGAYSITKSGLETFSNILRLEMKPFNVKVCTIRPGNFLAASNITGIAGEEPARTARHFWDQLGDTVQKDYGKQILEKEIATLQILTKIAVRKNNSISLIASQRRFFERSEKKRRVGGASNPSGPKKKPCLCICLCVYL